MPPCGESQVHKDLVARLKRQGASSGYFLKATEFLFGDLLYRLKWKIWPDAWLIDVEHRQLTIYEVIVKHPPEPGTRIRYAHMSRWLPQMGWKMVVVLIDENGNRRSAPIEEWQELARVVAARCATDRHFLPFEIKFEELTHL